MTPDLFAREGRISLADGAVQLPGFAADGEAALLAGIAQVTAFAPWRHLVTPGGLAMSVAMSNCGALGWHSDRQGYRYVARDPLSGAPWPAMPDAFRALATAAAAIAGFDGFIPDACLINRYVPGTKLSLHQDRDEADTDAPIVSVSLGLPAVFLLGGTRRAGPVRKVPLLHGDVVVWGGKSRLAFHGVAPVPEGEHPLLGRQRINLTLRKAG
jgi:alkylated DNA repair protein (DNA oxidative demethylase)